MALSHEAIQREVANLRKDAKLRGNKPVSMVNLANASGVTLRIGPLPDEMSGFLLYHNGTIILGVNSSHSRTRQNFTIAHELGHLRLHADRSFIDRDFPVFFRDARSATSDENEEVEANRFAAELLMPETAVRQALGKNSLDIDDEQLVRTLAREFSVSSQAMTFRLVNLGLARQ